MQIDPRSHLTATASDRGISLASLSRLLRRNEAYLHQFVTRGSPRVLSERDRRTLADYLAISEQSLGAPPAERAVAVRRIDAAASAGPGSLSDDDRLLAVDHFPESMLRRLGLAGRPLSMIVARGDSMEPGIGDGDEVLVDTGDRRIGAADGVFVFRYAGALLVKRLSSRMGRIVVVSDNPETPPINPLDPREVEVVGRVVWLSRRLR